MSNSTLSYGAWRIDVVDSVTFKSIKAFMQVKNNMVIFGHSLILHLGFRSATVYNYKME